MRVKALPQPVRRLLFPTPACRRDLPAPRRSALRIGLCLFLTLLWTSVPPVAGAEAPERATLDGNWKWLFTMRDGSRIEPKAKLKQKGDTLTGITLLRAGQEAPILDGKIQGDTVQWTVVREHEGRKVTTHYQGKLVGETLSGFIESDWNGVMQRYDWQAQREPDSPTGVWRWVSGRRPPPGTRTRGPDTKGTFKLEGEKVIGKVTFAGHDLELKHGRFHIREFSFQTIRERDGEKTTTSYRGKIEGDTLKGQIETDTGREIRTRAWEATRVEE